MPPVIAVTPQRSAAAAVPNRGPIASVAASQVPVGAVVILSTPPFQGFGWAYLQDSQYTQASPLVIAAGQTQQITIDGLGASSDVSYLKPPFAGWPFWHDGKFWPYSIGDDYELRLDFTAQSVAINNNVHAILSIGSAAGPVFDQVEPFGVGAGATHAFWINGAFAAKIGPGLVNLPKSAAAPAAPGTSLTNVYVLQGSSGAGFCTLYVQGTSSVAIASNYPC